jgi:hypothetical protein
MKKANENTGVALLIAGKSVPEQLEAINTALSNLQSIKESSYKTSMNVDGFGDLKTCTDIKLLIKALSSINGREKAYTEAAMLLGLKSVPAFEIGGGNTKDWTKDIKFRIAIISEKDVREKLQKAHDKLSQFLTDEEKRKQAENEMASLLSGLELNTTLTIGE